MEQRRWHMYKKNIDDVVYRLGGLFSGGGHDRIYAKLVTPSDALRKFSAENMEAEVDYPDMRVRAEFWDDYQRETELLEDDSFPHAYMSEFDEGLYAALLGAEIRFLSNPEWGWVSSMSPPFVSEADGLKNLRFDEDCEWMRKYTEQLSFYAEFAKSKFGISHFIVVDGLALLMEIRGATNMYFDCVDEEGTVREFIALAREVNCRVQDKYFDIIGLYEGGTVSNMAQWIPGRIISESLDPFHMADLAFFEKWGRGYLEEIFDHYDGGVCHLHSGNGMDLISSAASLKGLKMIFFVDEGWNEYKAYHDLEIVDKRRGSVPVGISIPYDIFVDKLTRNALPGNILYTVTGTPSISEGNRLMEKVRAYRC